MSAVEDFLGRVARKSLAGVAAAHERELGEARLRFYEHGFASGKFTAEDKLVPRVEELTVGAEETVARAEVTGYARGFSEGRESGYLKGVSDRGCAPDGVVGERFKKAAGGWPLRLREEIAELQLSWVQEGELRAERERREAAERAVDELRVKLADAESSLAELSTVSGRPPSVPSVRWPGFTERYAERGADIGREAL